jgi:dipeptidyl aminopeptidase/acylaminoacyl peptidase
MHIKYLTTAVLAVFAASSLHAQVPRDLSGRLLFKLGVVPAGSESYRVEQMPDGGYRLSGDVDLQVPGFHIVQHLEVEAGARLAFRNARVQAAVNNDSTEVTLTREDGEAQQTTIQADSTSTASITTPEHSVLLTNNVIHHIAQFAWLYDGALGETQEFVAFPRVPVTVKYEQRGTAMKDGEALAFRRYFLNLANRLGAYVWLADDGTALKVLVPLQAFEAVSEAHQHWADRLSLETEKPEADAPPSDDYDAEEVRFESDTVTLAGTLTTPRGEGPWPAAVLITGSGPQDRDENTPGPGGLKLGIFRSIADTLTRRDIAVLRYDDRGVGASGGNLGSAGLSDLVADVQAAVRFLRGRSEIDGTRIALIGHSEGGIVAPIVAADDSELAAIVLMAGTATSLDSVIIEQTVSAALEAGGDSADLARAREMMEEFSQAIREGRDLEETDLPAGLKALEAARKWLREHMQHDPLATIREVQAPVLIVNGGQDIQVAPEHARRLGAALREGGHPDYEVKIFPRLNHLFAVSRGAGAAEYADPGAEVDSEFLSYLADWLTARLTPR